MNDIAIEQDAAQLREEILRLSARYAELAHGAKPFDPARSPVPVNGKVFGPEEMVSLVDSALDFWLTTGRYAKIFERELARFVGTRYSSLANSGSSANLLAISALTSPLLGGERLVPGDEVITVAAGFPTTPGPGDCRRRRRGRLRKWSNRSICLGSRGRGGRR